MEIHENGFHIYITLQQFKHIPVFLTVLNLKETLLLLESNM